MLREKRLFKHGGSFAINVPRIFANNGNNTVIVTASPGRVTIRHKTEADTVESDPLFSEFINAILIDALKHPEKLKDTKEVWDREWDELLKHVSVDDE